MKFSVGDLVIVARDIGDANVVFGKVGVVRQIDYSIGVEFMDFYRGHTCAGRCEKGSGWYVNEDALEYYHDEPVTLEDLL